MPQVLDYLFVSSDVPLNERLSLACSELELQCRFASDFDQTLGLIEQSYYRFIFIYIEDSQFKSLQLLEWLQTQCLPSKIGVISQKSYSQEFLKALEVASISHFVTYDCDVSVLKDKLGTFLNMDHFQNHLQGFQNKNDTQNQLNWIGMDDHSRRLLELAQTWINEPISVLISGEKGVGKKHLSAILTANHDKFECDAQQIPVNEQKKQIMDKVKEHLSLQNGKLKSLTIHHIDKLQTEVQEFFAELLKADPLEANQTKFFPIFQFVATTTISLLDAVKHESFRKDLFQILNENHWKVKPLRERKQDIPLFVQHFIGQLSNEDKIHYFSKDAMTSLINYDWPENLDELKDVVLEILKSTASCMISSQMMPAKILEKSFYTESSDDEDLSELSYNEAKKRVLNNFNRAYIADLLKKSEQNLTVAAEKAGMDRSNFKKIIKKYGLM